MLANRETYEIMKPEDVGVESSLLVLGKHSGRAALKQRVEDMKFTLSEEALDQLFTLFKELADTKKDIFDKDLEKLIRTHNLI